MAGLSLEEIRARGLGTVVATLTIDFHQEIRAGQLILVRGALTHVGTKSFSHEMRLYEADAMTHCATQKTVEVCFDTPTRKAVALPDDMRDKLAKCVIQ
jgi:acyl-CoA thioester hydrolase